MREAPKEFHFLTLLSEDKNNYTVKVKCICGSIKDINRANWLSGKVKSCGCQGKYLATKRTKRALTLMKYRCNKESSSDYKHYGARGIKVCKEWEDSFLTFFNDMGNCPENHSIERLDVNKGYCKDNCIWADSKIQANNKRNSHILEYKGERKSLSLFAEEYGLKFTTLKERLNRGWNIHKALTTKARKLKIKEAK